MSKTSENIKKVWARIEGCGDNSCILKKPGGMGTNGGCRCRDARPAKMNAILHLARLAKTAADEIDELEAR